MSTSKNTERTYHHGDLRVALIEAGMEALEGSDAQSVSLRELARHVGVSPTAVYRHFPDKKALLSALAHEGINRLGEAQAEASRAAGGGAAGFAATGRAYVRFALAHPALFRLTFMHGDHGTDQPFGDNEAARLLREYAETFAGPDAARLQLQAWAVAHGLAMLMLDGMLPGDDSLIDAVIDTQTLFPAQSSSQSGQI